MLFEWDNNKNQLNIQKHGLSFEHAKLLFDFPMLIKQDYRFEYQEKRYIGYGKLDGRLMCIIYTERKPNKVRIISFRKANKRETEYYKKVYDE
jgi:uncharacterized DUF497 family protein